MKTPREILLERHRSAEPDLDRIRRQAIAAGLRPQAELDSSQASRSRKPLALFVCRKLWLDLFWPARRIWTGFALVWLVIVAVNLADAERPAVAVARSKSAPAGMMAAWQEQQRMLAELVAPATSQTAPRLKPVTPKPRSERHSPWHIG